MQNSDFITLRLLNLSAEQVEDFTYFLFDLGAQGVSEDLNFSQPSRDYEPKILNSDQVTLQAYFLISDLENLKTALEGEPFKAIESEVLIEKTKDWMSEWRKHFKSFCVSDDLWVHPAWEKNNVDSNIRSLFINPGMAFGTGTHSTTKLCLKALDKILDKEKYESALDMGAGSAILSILISQKKVSKVTACEIDEMARENAKENLSLNSCADVKVIAPEDLPEKSFELVVANIIDGVLLKLKDQLINLCEKTLVLSGILEENLEELSLAFTESKDFKVTEVTQDKEWVCVVLKRVS